MKALSIRQPWAHLIIWPNLVTPEQRSQADFKDVENRTWHTKFRGRFLVHAAQGMTRNEYQSAYLWGMESGGLTPPFDFPEFEDLQRGGIIGSVELYDSVDTLEATFHSPWYMGQKGFMLRNPEVLPFIPLKGRLGFFDVPDEVLR